MYVKYNILLELSLNNYNEKAKKDTVSWLAVYSYKTVSAAFQTFLFLPLISVEVFKTFVTQVVFSSTGSGGLVLCSY